MKNVHIITVPYDSSHYNVRMGTGPVNLIHKGLIQTIRKTGVEVTNKELNDFGFRSEISTSFKLINLVKKEVEFAFDTNSLPIVLSGNCNISTGIMAAFEKQIAGIIWFDAHGDCHTPDTTTSGFMDGMALSMITGKSWKSLISRVSNNFIAGNHIAHIGGRAISKSERDFIAENRINLISVKDIQGNSTNALEDIKNKFIHLGIEKLHIHFDVDSIDPMYAPSNTYSEENGLRVIDVIKTIQYLSQHFEIASLNIASYDAVLDHEDKMYKIIEKVIVEVLRLVNEGVSDSKLMDTVMAGK